MIATPVEDGTLIGRTRGTHKKCAHGKRRVVAPVRPQPVRPAGDADAGEGVEGNREKVGAPRSPEEPGQADNAGEVHEAQVDDHGGVDGSDLLVRDLLDHGGAVVGRASDAAVVSAGMTKQLQLSASLQISSRRHFSSTFWLSPGSSFGSTSVDKSSAAHTLLMAAKKGGKHISSQHARATVRQQNDVPVHEQSAFTRRIKDAAAK